MSTGRLRGVVGRLRNALARGEAGTSSDADLLGAFLDRRDESAFAEMVHRHGPMVLGVCRRILHNLADAEDAFQATFLVLVRRGHAVRPRGQVGNWLYGVACRVAGEARRAAARRRAREARAMVRVDAGATPADDLWPVLDQELSRLPDRYRAPVVLCDVEGKTRKEAACQLGWSEGTVSSRLSRARLLLARRLTRRGVGLTGAGLAVALGGGAATAAVPGGLARTTVRAASLLAAGSVAGAAAVAARPVLLVERVVRAMWMTRIKLAAVMLLGLAAVAGLVALRVRAGTTAPPTDPPAAPVAPDQGPAQVAAAADGKQTLSIKDLPPAVVKTSPRAGDTEVDAGGVTEIRVTFSKDMMDRTWSWSQVSDDTFPKTTGEPHYDKDRRTCALPVKLEPGKTYVLWINSEKFANFKDTAGMPAVPYLLVFETRPAAPKEGKKHQARLTGGVRDPRGQPIVGATVLVNRCQGAVVEIGKMTARTGKDGTYTVPLEFWDGDVLEVCEVWAEHPGHVRGQDQDRHPVKEGDTLRLDFALSPGEPLRGTVRVPLSMTERMAGATEKDQVVILDVVGPGFQQYHQTRDGGRFEVYVPPGEYSIRLLNPPRAEWKGLRPGGKELVLTPPRPPFDEALRARAFGLLWEKLDREYSYFTLKKDVDWNALKAEYRPRALRAATVAEFVEVLRQMLANLHDLHVWIATPGGTVGTYRSSAPRNYNTAAVLAALEATTKCGTFAVVGRTRPDGFGYFLMAHQSAATPESVLQAVKALRALKDVPGFVVDLREANGGNEDLAREIARLFCARDTVYARSKYRTGKPDHDDFGPVYDRVLKASGEPLTQPVVCLVGRRCVSSGEGFAQMMKCLPQVTLVGAPTRGASGNPRPVDLPGLDVAVLFSSWVDLMPDGSPIEGVGIRPDVAVALPEDAYRDRDPTLEKALEVLRRKTK
jgi:RNA polymerase sigma-70 factor (ECF subfamily)